MTERAIISKTKRTAASKLRRNKIIGQAYCIIAIALNKKGEFLGITANKAATYPGQFNHHAEGRLMIRYGKNIHKILIARFGRSGKQRPIDPCEQCAKQALKRGIIIEEIKNYEY